MISYLILFLKCYTSLTCSNCTVQYTTTWGLGKSQLFGCDDVSLKVCSPPLPLLVLSEFRVTKPYVLCHKKRVPSWWLLLVSVKLWIDGVLCQDSLWIKKIFCFNHCCLGSCGCLVTVSGISVFRSKGKRPLRLVLQAMQTSLLSLDFSLESVNQILCHDICSQTI